ncbi:MAG: universal stress protein [Desulfobacteraceae bacterium]|jgi:nucleotide-binding universal stress UspA family protein
MEITKILYVTDKEKTSFSDVERLMALRRLGLEEITLLNPKGDIDWGKRVGDYGVKSKTLAAQGPILPRILSTVEQVAASMIAVNLNKETKKVFSGSLIKQLLRSTPVPILLLNEDAQPKTSEKNGIFDHVIFATDWSPLSDVIIRYLLGFKEIIEMVEIVNVISKRLSIRDMRALNKRLVKTRKIFLDEGIDAEAHVYAGKTAEEIMLAALEYGATAIVMGTSRKSPLRAFSSGSCSYRVAGDTLLPALFIPSVGRLGITEGG